MSVYLFMWAHTYLELLKTDIIQLKISTTTIMVTIPQIGKWEKLLVYITNIDGKNI